MPLIFVAIGVALLGILLIGLADPLRRGEIEPNHTVGLRTADTLADPLADPLANPQVWYAANAASGRDLFRFGVALVAAAVLLPWLLGRAAIPVLLVLVVGGLLAVAVLGSLRAARLRAARRPDAPERSTPPAG